MRIATSLLALTLATGAAAQEFPEWKRLPGNGPNQTLEQRLEFSTPEAAQMFVSRNIAYVEKSEKIYGHKPDEFVRLPTILGKGMGNCKEGFVAMAGFLRQQGYDVTGIALNPEEGPGHIVVMYQGKDGKLGTAGISQEDFIPPVYTDEAQIINALALQHRWTRAKASQVYVDERLFTAGPPVTLKRRQLGLVDLEKTYGVSFKTEEHANASYMREILQDGYRIRLHDALIVPKASTGVIGGKITDMRVNYYGKDSLQVSIDFQRKLTDRDSVNVYFNDAGVPRSIQINKHIPRLRMNGITAHIPADFQGSSYTDDGITVTRAEADAYIKAAQSVMTTLQQQEVHQMFLRQNAAASARGVLNNTP